MSYGVKKIIMIIVLLFSSCTPSDFCQMAWNSYLDNCKCVADTHWYPTGNYEPCYDAQKYFCTFENINNPEWEACYYSIEENNCESVEIPLGCADAFRRYP